MVDYRERYEDELDESQIPSVNPKLFSNIKQLRLEKRLTTKELASLIHVDEALVISWEKNQAIPSPKQIKEMITYLKISYADMMTRDILAERLEAERRIKHSKERANYDWYYGSRTRIILYLVYLTCVPSIFLLAALGFGNLINNIFKYSTLYSIFNDATKYLVSYGICSIISGVIITIRFFTRINYRFQLWHIFWISTLFWLVLVIGVLATIPYYIYIIVILIVKRGRNHL